MYSQILSFYWNEHKVHCLNVLNLELKDFLKIEDNSYLNDECPSVLLADPSGKEYKLFLPSDYRDCGEKLNAFVLYVDDDNFLSYFNTIGEAVLYFQDVLNFV